MFTGLAGWLYPSFAIDNSADELELCDRNVEIMFPAEGSDDPMLVRYFCVRCDHVGEEAFGPKHQIEEVRAQAEALFEGAMSCQALL